MQWRHHEWWLFHYGDDMKNIVASRITANYLFNRLFRIISKKTSKPALLVRCEWNPPVTGGFPSQRVSNAESVSMLWRHYELWFFVSGLINVPASWVQLSAVMTSLLIVVAADSGKKTSKITSSSFTAYPWWRHQMETFSALLALCVGNSPVPVNSPHKGQWRGALMFSLICAWINDWENNREAGDLRCHRGHYDVNVMDGLMQKRRNLSTLALELRLFCIKPSEWKFENIITL